MSIPDFSDFKRMVHVSCKTQDELAVVVADQETLKVVICYGLIQAFSISHAISRIMPVPYLPPFYSSPIPFQPGCRRFLCT